MTDPVGTLLAQARRLAATGRDDEAKAAYLEILRRDPFRGAKRTRHAGVRK